MKKVIAFVILYSSLWILWTFFIQCPCTDAQWEGAKVQRLTYNTSPNSMLGFCIDKNEKLFLFYTQCKIDPYVQPYRDTLFLMSKEKAGEWSQPIRISTRPNLEVSCNKFVGYDPYTGLIHLFYNCPDDTLYYTNSSMPNWEVVKTDSGPDRPHPSAMAFDTLRNIHLAWPVTFDSLGYNWFKVMYANNSTGRWVKQQVSPPICLGYAGGGYAVLGVQKNGAAHIVYPGEPYCGLECQGFYVRNDSLNSANWVTDTVPRPSRPLWHYDAGLIEVDTNDRIHLISMGCIVEDCVWPRLTRTFYYSKQVEDSAWQGPEQIPDTIFGFISYTPQLLVDEQEIPYMGMQTTSMEAYFTDRKQGSWQVPHRLVGWNGDPDSLEVDDFCFVLDSQGKGHGAFVALHLRQLYYDDDSLEIYYLSSNDSFVDTSEDHKIFYFELFQNHPNPFNSSTIIDYEMMKEGNVTLKIYDILGKEVRTLVNTLQKPGNYRAIWDGKNNQGKEVASGIYFYLLKAGERKEGRKMLLIK
jgi:hypothetical protein